jgi:hypothetical protein
LLQYCGSINNWSPGSGFLPFIIKDSTEFQVCPPDQGYQQYPGVPGQQFQKALGSINDVAQLCPFLKGFRKPANDYMASFLEDTEVLLQFSLALMAAEPSGGLAAGKGHATGCYANMFTPLEN